MFSNESVWAYPTDTSFGLGARCDDAASLQKIMDLKQRAPQKYFSLMVKDFEMLKKYAEVPSELTEEWFFESPKSIILKPTKNLPESKFWPKEKVAFRICTIPDIAQHIQVPVTATSANISGQEPIFTTKKLKALFDTQIKIYDKIPTLPQKNPSEIYDATTDPWTRIR